MDATTGRARIGYRQAEQIRTAIGGSSVCVRMPALDVETPALLIRTLTSGAASAAAWMDAGLVTSRLSGAIRSSSPGAGAAGGGVDLRGTMLQGFLGEMGSDAAVGSGDEDDGSVE